MHVEFWDLLGLDDRDACHTSHSDGSLCSYATESGGDELSLRQRRDRRQRVRRADRNIRGAFGAAQSGLSERYQLFKIMNQFEMPD